MKTIKLIILIAATVISLFSFSAKHGYSNTQSTTTSVISKLDTLTYIPTLIDGVWWMYVYEDDKFLYCYPIEE